MAEPHRICTGLSILALSRHLLQTREPEPSFSAWLPQQGKTSPQCWSPSSRLRRAILEFGVDEIRCCRVVCGRKRGNNCRTQTETYLFSDASDGSLGYLPPSLLKCGRQSSRFGDSPCTEPCGANAASAIPDYHRDANRRSDVASRLLRFWLFIAQTGDVRLSLACIRDRLLHSIRPKFESRDGRTTICLGVASGKHILGKWFRELVRRLGQWFGWTISLRDLSAFKEHCRHRSPQGGTRQIASPSLLLARSCVPFWPRLGV